MKRRSDRAVIISIILIGLAFGFLARLGGCSDPDAGPELHELIR